MAEKRRGLGRGIGALIPTAPTTSTRASRPADIFFDGPTQVTSPDAPSEPMVANTAQHGRRPEERDGTTAPADTTAALTSATPANTVSATGTTAGPDTGTVVDPSADGTSALVAGARSVAQDDAVTPFPDPVVTDRPPAGPVAVGGDAAGTGADVDGLRPVPGASYAEVPTASIVPNRQQPRQVFDEDDLDELAASIRELGVLQPVVVRPVAPEDDRRSDTVRYELVMGERRLRASMQAGLTAIPAVIRETEDDDLLRDALLENLHRAQLNPLEEAAAYQQLLDDFACTHEELATRIARSRPQISNTLRLLKLPALVQRRVAAGVLSAGHARALLGLEDGAAMERLAQRIVAEGMSVRATEEAVALGDGPGRPEMRRRAAPSTHAEQLDRLATRLADRLDTRVKVTMGARKGRLTVDFASIEDLDRILDTLAPGEQVAAD